MNIKCKNGRESADGLIRLFAYYEEKEKTDKYQDGAAGESQSAAGEKYQGNAGKHYYEGNDINYYRIFVSVHNNSLYFNELNIS